MITPQDDFFHERTDDPFWNESSWLSFMVPDRDLSGWVYFYHRPNMRYSLGGVAIWDPTGDQTYDCRYYDWGEPFPLADDANMFDFALGNGLTVSCVVPGQEIALAYHGTNWYEGRGCDLDLTFRGFRAPVDSGLPRGAEEWGTTGHYEQPGRMTGTIVVGGERFEIDCWSERDRSWGPRRLKNNPRGTFPWAIASEQSAFQLLGISQLPQEDDPGVGTTEDVITGWYIRDGVCADVSRDSGKVQVVERGPDGRPLRLQCSATDQLGRTFEAEGRAKNMLNWHGYSFMYQWWGLYEWSFDGQTAFGECQDYWPLQQARKVIRDIRGV